MILRKKKKEEERSESIKNTDILASKRYLYTRNLRERERERES